MRKRGLRNKQIAQYFKIARTLSEMTQKEVAEMTGYSERQIRYFESGDCESEYLALWYMKTFDEKLVGKVLGCVK